MTVSSDESGRIDTEIRIPPTVDSPQAKLVYLSLCALGEGTIEELHRVTAMSKLSLYTILRHLEHAAVIDSEDSVYRVRETC